MKTNKSNRVRIIGGIHRNRRIVFPNLPSLRPTSDRMRETLFNWLQPTIDGSHCLDLFAGSGILGLEAVSRQARQVVMIDIAPQVVQQLRNNLQLLNINQDITQVEVIQANALHWLRQPIGKLKKFDIIFIDPPYEAKLTFITCKLLEQFGWIHTETLLYLECPKIASPPILPENFSIIKKRFMGQVWGGLAVSNTIL